MGKMSKTNSSCLMLSAILIDNELRGYGYAKKLIKNFLEKAFENKAVDKIELHFRGSSNLQGFYEKFDFNNHHVCGTYKNGEAKHCMEISRSDIMGI